MLPKTRQELAKEYNVSPKTFRKWLKEYKIDLPKGVLPPRVIETVYHKLGVPKNAKVYQNFPFYPLEKLDKIKN